MKSNTLRVILDKDLLVIGKIENTKIITITEFIESFL